MKKLMLVGLVLALAGGLVALGWSFGRGRRAWDGRDGVSLLERRIVEGEVAVSMLRELDAGHTNVIRRQLQMQVFASVVAVDGLFPYADRQTQELCRNLFADIAGQRASGSPSFAGNLGLGEEAGAKLESVLRKVRGDTKQ